MNQRQVPDFNDQQLQEIIELCRRDAKVCAFIETMDPRAVDPVGTRTMVQNTSYVAGLILDYRKQVREALARKQADEDAKKGTEAPPRIPAAEIPEIKPQSVDGNGSSTE